MPAPYDLPTNISTYQGMFSYINDSVTNWFGILILLACFMIPFGALSIKYGRLRAFTVSSWITFLMSIFLTILGLTPQITIYSTFCLVIISVGLLWKGGNQ